MGSDTPMGFSERANMLAISFGGVEMVGPNGLEPSTSSVSGRRSNQLSYGPICERFWTQFYGQKTIPATFASAKFAESQADHRLENSCRSL